LERGEEEVAQAMYTHVSKCKNGKIKGETKRKKKKNLPWLAFMFSDVQLRVPSSAY
jgi:hypothetical protein